MTQKTKYILWWGNWNIHDIFTNYKDLKLKYNERVEKEPHITWRLGKVVTKLYEIHNP